MKMPLRLTALCRLAVYIAFACGVKPAFAASFDCTKAGSDIEHAICDTPALSELDSTLDNHYARAMADLPVDQASALRVEQRAWLKKRNACTTNASELKTCLETTMKARATALEEVRHRAASDFDAAVSLIPDSPRQRCRQVAPVSDAACISVAGLSQSFCTGKRRNGAGSAQVSSDGA